MRLQMVVHQLRNFVLPMLALLLCLPHVAASRGGGGGWCADCTAWLGDPLARILPTTLAPPPPPNRRVGSVAPRPLLRLAAARAQTVSVQLAVRNPGPDGEALHSGLARKAELRDILYSFLAAESPYFRVAACPRRPELRWPTIWDRNVSECDCCATDVLGARLGLTGLPSSFGWEGRLVGPGAPSRGSNTTTTPRSSPAWGPLGSCMGWR
jgi:hypothetical protein